jgi:hypothetical protein
MQRLVLKSQAHVNGHDQTNHHTYSNTARTNIDTQHTRIDIQSWYVFILDLI